MASYDLIGSGVQGLTSGTTHLFVHVTTFPLNFGQGRSTPTNYYDLGLLRFSFQGAVYPVIPIDARDMILLLPVLADALGYNLFGGTFIHVIEA